MVIPFNAEKTIQAAAVLLKEHAGRMSRLRLLKLLYIADRNMLADTLRPITGDHPVAMPHGPVMSHTYDLIKRGHISSPRWDQFIAQQGPQDVALIRDPRNGRLSKLEIETLIGVCREFENQDDYQIAVYTHGFEEFKKNEPKSPKKTNPIPRDDLLAALGLSDQKSKLHKNERAEADLDRLLAPARKR